MCVLDKKFNFLKLYQIFALNCKLTEIIAKIEIPQKSHTLECNFAIFKPKKFKLCILIDCKTTNDTSGFCDKLSISSGIELELGLSRIKIFFLLQKSDT
jgi:hypothetical protein